MALFRTLSQPIERHNTSQKQLVLFVSEPPRLGPVLNLEYMATYWHICLINVVRIQSEKFTFIMYALLKPPDFYGLMESHVLLLLLFMSY